MVPASNFHCNCESTLLDQSFGCFFAVHRCRGQWRKRWFKSDFARTKEGGKRNRLTAQNWCRLYTAASFTKRLAAAIFALKVGRAQIDIAKNAAQCADLERAVAVDWNARALGAGFKKMMAAAHANNREATLNKEFNNFLAAHTWQPSHSPVPSDSSQRFEVWVY